MRDRMPSLLLSACAGILACALAAATWARADDVFGPDPLEPAPKPPLQCPASAASGVDLQARIAEIQRQISARQAAAPPAEGGGVMLNGSGYNYGSANGYLEQGALSFEAKQAR